MMREEARGRGGGRQEDEARGRGSKRDGRES